MVSRLYRTPDPGVCLNPALDPLAPTIISERAAAAPVYQPAAAVAPQPWPAAWPPQPPAYAQPAQAQRGLPPPAYMGRY